MNRKWLFAAAGLTAAACFFASCSKDKKSIDRNDRYLLVVLSASGPRYEGTAYTVPPLPALPATDVAVWITDKDGRHVKTLAVTPSVVSVGNYSHVDHLPAFAASAGVTYEALQAETGGQMGVAPSFDAVTMASPLFESDAVRDFQAVWDMTDDAGAAVAKGNYTVWAETANIVKNDPTIYTIRAENTSVPVDLVQEEAGTAAATAHIRSVAVSFVSDVPEPAGNILEP
ncbi:hypothetical protein JW777_06485 [bacterium]|nr:hypothetical protein [bacterium]